MELIWIGLPQNRDYSFDGGGDDDGAVVSTSLACPVSIGSAD